MKVDITEIIINHVDGKFGNIDTDIPINNNTLIGVIIVTDTRNYKPPYYDSCDGLPVLISGEVSIDLYDLTLIDANGNEEEYEINETLINETLNF